MMANTYKTTLKSFVIGLFALLVISPAMAIAQFAGGDGSAASPWQIETKAQLDQVRNNLTAHYVLNNDIVFDAADFEPTGDFYNGGTGWQPIGGPVTDVDTPFGGSFDGNGFSISGLQITNDAANDTFNFGLFGVVRGAEITNLTLIDVDFSANQSGSLGGIVGFAQNGTLFVNNHVQGGTLNGFRRVGGVVGRFQGLESLLSESSSSATVKANDMPDAGFAGGLVGVMTNSPLVSRSHSTGNVENLATGSNAGDVGGLVGYMRTVTAIRFSYSTGTVTVAGGNSGINRGIGGLVGRIDEDAIEIRSSYTTSDVVVLGNDNRSIGGLVGRMTDGEIVNSYASGKMHFGGTIVRDQVGGLVGSWSGLLISDVRNSYWNVESTGLDARGVDVGISRTTAQMKRQSTFTDWDFDTVWQMSRRTTLPYLRDISRTVPAGPEIGRIFNQAAWRHMGSAFDGMTYSELLESIWTQGVPGSDNPAATAPNIFEFVQIPVQPGTCGEWTPVSDMNSVIPAGTGFAVYVFNADFDGQPIDDQGFPKSILIDAAPISVSEYQANIITAANCWSHASNSYMFPVSWQDVFNASTNVREVVYVYDSRASEPGYRVWNALTDSGDSELDGMIAPFQAFFINNSGNGAELVVPASAQIFNETSNFLNRTPGNLAAALGLRAELEGFERERNMQVVFSGMESAHGLALAPMDAISYVDFAAIGSTGDLHRMHNVAATEGSVSIPLALRNMVFSETGWFEESGEFNISWNGLDNFPQDWAFSITDTETGSVYNLRDTEGFSVSIDVVQTNSEQPSVTWSLAPSASTASVSDARFILNVVTGSPVNVGDDTEIAGAFSLDQNYPNPFNPTTTIRYTLNQSSDVRLDVFNLMGQRVATLTDGFQQSGTHTISFDASNLASGVYLYRLQAGTQIQTRKMTLIK